MPMVIDTPERRTPLVAPTVGHAGATAHPTGPDQAPAIQVEGLNFYYGHKKALDAVSMNIERNQVTALIGPSGCGKFTFLRALNRMNDLIDGTRVEGLVRVLDGKTSTPADVTSSICAAGSAWSSRSRTRSPSRSSRTSSTARASPAW